MVSVDYGACFLGALMLLVSPLDWLSAAFFAALFHEACHILAVSLVGGTFRHISVGMFGAKIELSPMENHKELLCALAGPVGSFLLLFACRIFPKLAICAAIQGIFNLLPVYPMDGGRILSCIFRILCPANEAKIMCGIERLVLLLSVLLLLWLGLHDYGGVFPAIFAVLLILKRFRRKIPCKRTRIGVQ